MLNLFLACVFFATFMLKGGDLRWLLVAVGHLSVPALLLLPTASSHRISVAEPLTLFLIFILIGTVATSHMIAFTDTPRRNYIVSDTEIDRFIVGGLWLVGGLFFVGLGYTACNQRIRVERIFPSDKNIRRSGIALASIVVVVISLLATVQYLNSTGGFTSIADLSRKRSIEIASGGEIVYGNAAYVQQAGTLAVWLLYIAFAYYLKSGERLSLGAKILFGVLVVVSLAIPFVSSSRASIGYTLIGLLFIYGIHRKVSTSLMISVLLAFSVLFSAMTGLRAVSQSAVGGEAEVFVNPAYALAESGNGLSIAGTAHILDGVPRKMDYQLGITFFSWITAPIPRSIWPGKPDVSLGKEIKEKIMGETVVRTGRPPSILTEGYINFGFVGFFLVSVAFGYVLKLSANSFLPVLSSSSVCAAVYFALITNLGALANAAFSQSVVRQITDVVCILLVYLVATRLWSTKRLSFGRVRPVPR